MRTFTTLLISALVLVALVGCGGDAAAPTGYAPGQEVEAYAYVHGGYVGKAVVTTDDEGAMSATIDEAFLPHTIAAVNLEDDAWSEDNTVSYESHGNVTSVAEYVAYNGDVYVGRMVGNTLVYVPADENGQPSGSPSLEKMILRNEDNMKAYFDGIQDGAFEVFTEFGGDPMTVTTTSYGSLTKRGSTYWNFGSGWEGNVDAIAEAAAQNGIGYSLDDLSQNSDGEWEVADATTAATASDFKDYFALIQQAAARLAMATE
jgi:hypothetical protein